MQCALAVMVCGQFETIEEKQNMKTSHIVELVVGDWSNSSHGKTRNFLISSNLPGTKVCKAYWDGVAILGFNPEDFVAAYGNKTLSRAFAIKLIKLGIEDSEWSWDANGNVDIYPGLFADIWLFVAKLGNPEFEFEKVEAYTVGIGGCGLFTQA
jgi:hypothetical protein